MNLISLQVNVIINQSIKCVLHVPVAPHMLDVPANKNLHACSFCIVKMRKSRKPDPTKVRHNSMLVSIRYLGYYHCTVYGSREIQFASGALGLGGINIERLDFNNVLFISHPLKKK